MQKRQLKDFCKSIGIGLVGVAPIERFKELMKSNHPSSIFPEAKNVIVIAQEIPRGHFRGIEEGTLWTQANKRILTKYIFEVARFIENEGFEAVPVVPNKPVRMVNGKPVEEGKAEPNVFPPLEFSAIAAGLGEIGFCGIFLTPEYGSRQSLGMIITDLELEADPIFEGTVCDREECKKCIEGCPLGAISNENTETMTYQGITKNYCVINYNLCRLCPNGAFPDTTFQAGTEENIVAISHNQPKSKDPAANKGNSQPNRLTAACNRACIAHLEEENKLSKQYNNPFRDETPWVLGIFDV
jgi:epoxyqueuosine reductase